MPAENPPAPGPSSSDPEHIRALAHPLRLRLLEVLDDEGPATATRCAEVTGESVASCSFHLHMLAKYGYVEPAERRGREKPWRAVGRRRDARYDPEQPGSLRAVREVAHLRLDREADRLHRWLDTGTQDSDEWLLASTLTSSSIWATAAELTELSAEVQRLTDRFAGRSDDPSLRPPGARRARLFAAVNADPVDAGDTDPDPAHPDPHSDPHTGADAGPTDAGDAANRSTR